MTAKVFWPTLMVLLIILVGLLVYLFPAFNYVNRLPGSGQWWCEELQLMLSFDKGTCGYYIENGQKIPCHWSGEFKTNDIYVRHFEEEGEPYLDYGSGSVIFSGYSIKCEDGRMTVREHDTRVKYIFVLADASTN